MIDDRRLLQDYVQQGSQSAFAELVTRHLKLVYTTCLREVGDTDSAEDMTQIVFLILAQKASKLPSNVLVTGWLFNTARFVSRNARRQSQRRQAKEMALTQTMPSNTSQSELWHQVEPILNDALNSLSARDRDIVLLRFFDDLNLTEIGTRFGISENAARMRLARAIEKMRKLCAKSGFTLSGVILTAALADKSAHALPPTCMTSVTDITSNLPPGDLLRHLIDQPIYSKFQGALHAMKITQMKRTLSFGIAGALLAALPFVVFAQKLTSSPEAKTILVNSEVRAVPQADWKQITAQAKGDYTKMAIAVRTKNYNLTTNPKVITRDGIAADVRISNQDENYEEKIIPKIDKNNAISLDVNISVTASSQGTPRTTISHANSTIPSGQVLVLANMPSDINAFVTVTILTPTTMPPKAPNTAP